MTTQLQNQNPLDPLDTNQFTQQLVEFASVEQQINMNTNLQTLISMQQTSEATSALQLVGSAVTVSGNSATLSNATSSPAIWNLNTSTPATANITVTSSAGTTAYHRHEALNAGSQSFTWNGKGNNGQTWPDGTYTLSINAAGANGQAVNVSSQVQGTVSGVNTSSKSADTDGGRTDRPAQPDHVDQPLIINATGDATTVLRCKRESQSRSCKPDLAKTAERPPQRLSDKSQKSAHCA